MLIIDDTDVKIRKLGRMTGKPQKTESGIILQKTCQDLKLARDTYQGGGANG